MKYYRASELERFLEALDQQLDGPHTITIIGGAAIALAFGGDNATTDIDVFVGMTGPLQLAAHQARRQLLSEIEVSPAQVAELPYGYEDRLRPILGGLAKLRVLVPELYDLVLSKIARGVDRDREHIAALHQLHQLELATLLERYFGEMQQATMRQRDLELNLLNVIDDLFGAEAAREVEAELESRRARSG